VERADQDSAWITAKIELARIGIAGRRRPWKEIGMSIRNLISVVAVGGAMVSCTVGPDDLEAPETLVTTSNGTVEASRDADGNIRAILFGEEAELAVLEYDASTEAWTYRETAEPWSTLQLDMTIPRTLEGAAWQVNATFGRRPFADPDETEYGVCSTPYAICCDCDGGYGYSDSSCFYYCCRSADQDGDGQAECIQMCRSCTGWCTPGCNGSV
jgi:hypothetical protein